METVHWNILSLQPKLLYRSW